MRDHEAIKKASQAHAYRRAFICKYFPKGGTGAEIGVLYGQFSEIILRVAKPQLLFLVDPWSHDDKFGDRTQEQMGEIAVTVREKFKNNRDVLIHRVKSCVFFDYFIMGNVIDRIDFIYIDGSHEYQEVLSDLHNAWNIVKPGGVIAGDDYGENVPLWGNSVKRAVDDFCMERGITPEIIEVPGENGKQFLIRR